MYTYEWVPSLLTWNYHNIVHGLYPSAKKKLKREKKKSLYLKLSQHLSWAIPQCKKKFRKRGKKEVTTVSSADLGFPSKLLWSQSPCSCHHTHPIKTSGQFATLGKNSGTWIWTSKSSYSSAKQFNKEKMDRKFLSMDTGKNNFGESMVTWFKVLERKQNNIYSYSCHLLVSY